ncbi:M56 family metallopeptidase [Daejeonella lutea]|uniref:BlaR1 peptidase M56 n=1 Tax=Daejeonella lutea TaxID=572036 RepID=A0A1T5EWW8_9SPHI|nr:M56 family metallopeptidase [Daejeonella lutea]SKB88358.1 BlaR1 peptidase M56 [Daejeonella lutea]
MPALFILLFKINVVLILFAAAYYFVLRKLTFYGLNRAFLIFGILFSSAYPFININTVSSRYDKIASIAPAIGQQVSGYIQPGSISVYWQSANFVFWTIVVLMAFRLAMQFFSLYRIHKNSSPGHASDYRMRILSDDLGPFSFWQTIYINPKLHSKTDLENILKHEKVHVDDWHTLDIILAELSIVFYWFNPGVWLMKRAVRENIEFITDAKILRKGIDKKTYQYSLLHAGNLVPAMAIVNNFSLSDLKKRIKMMNARRSSPLALSRYLFLLPILLLTTLAFTISKKAEIKKIIFSKPMLAISSPERRESQPNPKMSMRSAELKRTPSLAPAVEKDTLKRFLIIEAYDTDSGSVHSEFDELPMPKPGDRIKMITVRRTGEESPSTIFSDTDSLRIRPKNVFIVHRESGENPPTGIMNFRHIAGPGQSPDTGSKLSAKFFLNGEEISQEEFRKLELAGPDGAGSGKKLMIRVEKQ